MKSLASRPVSAINQKAAQGRDSPGQMSGDRTRGDAEGFRRGRGVQVEKAPQRDDLPLPYGQSAYGCQEHGVDSATRVGAGSRIVVAQGHFATLPPPP